MPPHTHKQYSFELLNLLQTREMNMDGENQVEVELMVGGPPLLLWDL